MKTFCRITILVLHVVIVILLLGLWFRLDVLSYITELGWCRVFVFLKSKVFWGYFLLLVVGVYLIYRTANHHLLFRHEKYLRIIVLSSLLVIFFPEDGPPSALWTAIQGVAISLFAGVVVAVYSELKNKAISERKELLAEIKDFQEHVEAMITSMDYENHENSKLALAFLVISKKQEEIRKKYNELWARRKASPWFGDELDVVHDIESRIEEGLNTSFSKEDWTELLASIRDSLNAMQRQVNLCVEWLEGEASAAEKTGH